MLTGLADIVSSLCLLVRYPYDILHIIQVMFRLRQDHKEPNSVRPLPRHTVLRRLGKQSAEPILNRSKSTKQKVVRTWECSN